MRALITGAAGGIGKSIAKLFQDNNIDVIASGTNAEKLESCGYKKSIICNLSQLDEVETLIARAEEQFGEIDILINNAGITKDKLSIMMKTQDFTDVMNVNLVAPFILSKMAIKSMLKRKFGRIINIGSVVGTMGNPGQVNYVASKAGLVGMSKAFALEVASHGITVNVVAPGFIQSEMTDKLNEKQKEAILSRIPMKKMGQGEDIAACCLFLASLEAGYITGQTLHSNGGMILV